MSERGSFITEYCYCDKCFEVLKKYLLGKDKFLCSRTIPTWDGCGSKLTIHNEEEVSMEYLSNPDNWERPKEPQPDLPIIAGKIGGSYDGEEIVEFETNLLKKISGEICHPVRIAVIPDSENQGQIYLVEPKTGKFKVLNATTEIKVE